MSDENLNQTVMQSRNIELNDIAKAIAKAQSEIQNVTKDAKNPHFKSQYASLAAVLDVVRPIFSKHGVCIVQLPISNEGQIGLKTMMIHDSGQSVESIISLPMMNVGRNVAQEAGSIITYLRRYTLAAMAGVAQEDDDGESVKTKVTPAGGVIESLPANEQHRLLDLSTVCKEYLDQGDVESALKEMKDADLDADSKVALWATFDSKQRRAMKDYENESSN